MPPASFEPAIQASERPQTLALDRLATGICLRQLEDMTFFSNSPLHTFWVKMESTLRYIYEIQALRLV